MINIYNRWVCNFAETGPIEFTNVWIWSSHVRAAAAPAARGTKTGGCGRDKESTAWFMAAHSGPECFKLNTCNYTVSYGCICGFCRNISALVSVFLVFLTLLSLFPPNKLLQHYYPFTRMNYCPGRGCLDAFMRLYPSLSSYMSAVQSPSKACFFLPLAQLFCF